MRVYIGSAIDTSLGSPQDQFKELAGLVAEALGSSVVVYDPLSAFHNAHLITQFEDLEFVSQMNNTAIDKCNAGVFSWTDSPSFGVPLEIQRFSDSKKPFIVWNRSTKAPGLYLRAAALKHGLGIITSTKEETANAVKALVGLVDAADVAKSLGLEL